MRDMREQGRRLGYNCLLHFYLGKYYNNQGGLQIYLLSVAPAFQDLQGPDGWDIYGLFSLLLRRKEAVSSGMRDASTRGDVSCYRACATLVTGHQGPHASLGLVMSLHGHKLTIKLIYCVQGNLLKLNVMVSYLRVTSGRFHSIM